MARSYCPETVRGSQVYMEPDPERIGKYVCAGCGATEEVVFATAEAMQQQWTEEGVGAGVIPELLKPYAIDGDPTNVTPFKEPWIETSWNSGRSLKELEQRSKELQA